MAQPKHARAKQARAAKTPSPPSPGAQGADAPKAVRGGIAQPVTPSPALGAIVGMEPLSRAELTNAYGPISKPTSSRTRRTDAKFMRMPR